MPKKTNHSSKTSKSKPDFHSRIIIENVSPQINEGAFPIKRVTGEKVIVRANIFREGHDEIAASVLYRKATETQWKEAAMQPLGNDQWTGSFIIEKEEDYLYTVRGYIDEFTTWQKNFEKKVEAKQDVSVECKIGIEILNLAKNSVQEASQKKILEEFLEEIHQDKDSTRITKVLISPELLSFMQANLPQAKSSTYPKELRVTVERKLALFSSWYEFFPRSFGAKPLKHGTFKDCEKLLPEIADMGFDIVYLPPIHPIGKTNRKGKNNNNQCTDSDPGCPWAIGSDEGGHKAIHPQLGDFNSFKHFIAKAKEHNLEVALDLAYQCSPDHPYVKEHPSWFKWRPDGKVQFAENPPKKYEDVLPINFETDDAENLWNELKSIVTFWAQNGIRVFRVDNPHTKPFLFWDWLIAEIKKEYPETIFLAEAFTRPSVMYRLAKGGFTQSYTYFTWRNTKKEFIDYLTELSHTEVAEYFRPNFWPNTPDILPDHLIAGERPAFIMRAVLASMLSSNFGVYGPAFELCVTERFPDKEEYLNSEKYEIKQWHWSQEGNLKSLLSKLNKIRKNNPALQETRNIQFCTMTNDFILAFCKVTTDLTNRILVLVNLDPYHTQSGMLYLPLEQLGIDSGQPFRAHDLLNDEEYIWRGQESFIELNPQHSPAHIIHLKNQ